MHSIFHISNAWQERTDEAPKLRGVQIPRSLGNPDPNKGTPGPRRAQLTAFHILGRFRQWDGRFGLRCGLQDFAQNKIGA